MEAERDEGLWLRMAVVSWAVVDIARGMMGLGGVEVGVEVEVELEVDGGKEFRSGAMATTYDAASMYAATFATAVREGGRDGWSRSVGVG